MHLGNGVQTPECVAVSYGAAMVGVGAAMVSARRSAKDAKANFAGAVAVGGFVLAAQAINFPVLPFASGHLVGGVLAACLLGPSVGALVIASVIAIQAFVLGDGGVSALGANVINMALLPAMMVAAAHRWSAARRPGQVALRLPLIGALALGAVVLAAGLIVGEIAWGRSGAALENLPGFAARMLSYHLWIGCGEALLTVSVLYAIGHMRTDSNGARKWKKRSLVAVSVVAAVALMAIIPLASNLPDGYAAAAQRSQMHWLLVE